jgi:hypothetical protein
MLLLFIIALRLAIIEYLAASTIAAHTLACDAVRSRLPPILQPSLRSENADTSHTAMILGNSSTGKTCNADMIFTTSSSVDAYLMDTLFAALDVMYSSGNSADVFSLFFVDVVVVVVPFASVKATLGAAKVFDSNASRWHTNNAFGKKSSPFFFLLESVSLSSLFSFILISAYSSSALDKTHSRTHLANNKEAVTPQSFLLVGAIRSAFAANNSSSSSSSSKNATPFLF